MTCKEDLSAYKIGNMFLGIKSLKNDKPEVLEFPDYPGRTLHFQ
jgi:hypothetical protein